MTYEETALAAARTQAITADAASQMDYRQVAALAGAAVDADGRSPADFFWECVRNVVVSELQADAEDSLADVGYCWEGQGRDPGVPGNAMGPGDGAKWFGLNKCMFLWEPVTAAVLNALDAARMVEVVLSPTPYLNQTSDERDDAGNLVRQHVTTKVTDFSWTAMSSRVTAAKNAIANHPNIKGVIFDSLPKNFEDSGLTWSIAKAAIGAGLKIWTVSFGHDMRGRMWERAAPHIDCLTLWAWQDDFTIDQHIAWAKQAVPNAALYGGIFLRDYVAKAAMDLGWLDKRLKQIGTAIQRGDLAGYCVLGTVLIDLHPDQAKMVKDWIGA